MTLTFETLLSAVSGNAPGIRSITELQPVGGVGDKVFPVTFSGGKYAEEQRRQDPTNPASPKLECILLDSVASQANRAEEQLLRAIRLGELQLPLLEVDFSEANPSFRVPLDNLTSLQVPHRLADAILRDSQLEDGTLFSKSDYAKEWGRATPWNATPIYQLCPTALLFGMWGSPEKPGGLGAKFERAFVSEIVGIDVLKVPNKTGFRIDPVGASSKVLVSPQPDGTFTIAEEKAKGAVRPSEINHSNILYESDNGGVRFQKAEQTTVISLGALRKLRFPLDGRTNLEIDDAGRTVIASLGLLAGVLAAERGGSLRSRCDLWPAKPREWELLQAPGQAPERTKVDAGLAFTLFQKAVQHAESKGLTWHPKAQPLKLKPTQSLIELIGRSQEVQAKAPSEEGK